jgi:pyruvate ferredoxin oxidoreductase alpha subunit
MHAKQMQALDLIPELAADFEEAFGRDSGGLLSSYRMEDADTVIVALGSVLGTIKDVIDELREQGTKIGVVGVKTFRPFPRDDVREMLGGVERVVVLEKAWAIGVGGIVGQNIRLSLEGLPVKVYDVIAGLGGRPIMKKSLRPLFAQALADELDSLTFLDLDRERVARELERQQAGGRPGPHAESMVKELGIVASRPH